MAAVSIGASTLLTNSQHKRQDSKIAQQDLWSRIIGDEELSPSSSPLLSKASKHLSSTETSKVPRYADAQRDRTLYHPKLVQPTTEQEKDHLAMLSERRIRVDNREAKHQQELVDKLSKALMLGTNNTNTVELSQKGSEDFPSPTSTLCFPEPHHNHDTSTSHNSDYDMDTFIGTCGFVANELEKLKSTQQSSTESTVSDTVFGEMEPQSSSHSFVICSDTQLGIASQNLEWETELAYSRQAVQLINELNPRPRFVSMCGDLIDMEYTFEERRGYSANFKTKEECDRVQDQQNSDFQHVWSDLHPDIAIVCVCGNHDVGNRPTSASIKRFVDAFGDEYLAFWVNGTYNVVLNNVLFVDHSGEGAQELFDTQLLWLEERLKYAHEHDAKMIFVHAHHPWFLVRYVRVGIS